MNKIAKLHPHEDITICPHCGNTIPEPIIEPIIELREREITLNPYQNHIGRIAIFELTTGTRIQGKILAVTDQWIDTDNGAIKVDHVVHAKWVGAEEASIIRGGPIRGY